MPTAAERSVKRNGRPAGDVDLVRDDGGVSISRQGRDRGTRERWRHDELTIEGDSEPHAKALQSPLDRYKARRELDSHPERNQALYEAGDRLRGDFYLAGLAPRVTANLLSTGPGNGDVTDRQIAARRRYRAAACAVDSELWSCLRHVVCLDETAADWALMKGWNRGPDGMVALRLGLSSLARHYGLVR